LEEGRPLEKELEGCLPSLQCLEAAARERERKEGRKGRKSLVLFVCLLFVDQLFVMMDILKLSRRRRRRRRRIV
jgi:hypothetical protein